MNKKDAGKIERIRARRIEVKGLINRFDASDDDVEWITVNGTHIPMKDGEAVGGPAKLRQSINSGEGEKSGGGASKSKPKYPASTTKVNSSIDSKWQSERLNGDYKAIENDINDAIDQMEDGDTFRMNDTVFTKKGKDRYVSVYEGDGSKDKWTASEIRDYMQDNFGDYESDAPKFSYLWNKGDKDDPEVSKRRNKKIKDMWSRNAAGYKKTVEKAADIMRDDDYIKIGEFMISRRKDGYFYRDPQTNEAKVVKTSSGIAEYINSLSDTIEEPPVFKYRSGDLDIRDPWM